MIDTQELIDSLLANPTDILQLKQKVVDICPVINEFIKTWNDPTLDCQNSLGIAELKNRYNQTYNVLLEQDIVNEELLRLVQETEDFCQGTQYGGNCETISETSPYITQNCMLALWNTIPSCTSLRLQTEILNHATSLSIVWWTNSSPDLDTVIRIIRDNYCVKISEFETYYANNPQCNNIQDFDTHIFKILWFTPKVWYKQGSSLILFEDAIENEIDEFCASTSQQCKQLQNGMVTESCITNLISETTECSDMTLDVYDIFKTQTDVPTLTTNLRQYCINYNNVKNYFNQQTQCQLIQNYYNVNDIPNIATSISSDGSDDFINDTLNTNAKSVVDNFCNQGISSKFYYNIINYNL